MTDPMPLSCPYCGESVELEGFESMPVSDRSRDFRAFMSSGPLSGRKWTISDSSYAQQKRSCRMPYQHSHPNHSPKPSRRVIRLHPVVVHEHPSITPVAEEGAAEGADVGRGVEPGGGLLVEFAQGL